MRGATAVSAVFNAFPVISIHAPHAGRDAGPLEKGRQIMLFQSTRPMRGATGRVEAARAEGIFQSTRPMRGATIWTHAAGLKGIISIHAPHAGRDGFRMRQHHGSGDFNPRAPCGARRINSSKIIRSTSISIHAPHAGRDCRGADRL